MSINHVQISRKDRYTVERTIKNVQAILKDAIKLITGPNRNHDNCERALPLIRAYFGASAGLVAVHSLLTDLLQFARQVDFSIIPIVYESEIQIPNGTWSSNTRINFWSESGSNHDAVAFPRNNSMAINCERLRASVNQPDRICPFIYMGIADLRARIETTFIHEMVHLRYAYQTPNGSAYPTDVHMARAHLSPRDARDIELLVELEQYSTRGYTNMDGHRMIPVTCPMLCQALARSPWLHRRAIENPENIAIFAILAAMTYRFPELDFTEYSVFLRSEYIDLVI